jgi:bifunctional non-homologous end joining protein LigD
MVVSDMKKKVRTGKVFVDWSQNDEHKTTVAVYSLRARERPTASTPVAWAEVERALKKKDSNLLVFEAPQVVKRADELGDLFRPVLELKQRLPDLKSLSQPAATGVREPISLAAQAEEKLPSPRRRVAKETVKKAATRPPARKARRKV